MICAVVANTVPRERGSKAFTVKDFMPGPAQPGEGQPMTDEEMEAAVRHLNARLGGIVKEE